MHLQSGHICSVGDEIGFLWGRGFGAHCGQRDSEVQVGVHLLNGVVVALCSDGFSIRMMPVMTDGCDYGRILSQLSAIFAFLILLRFRTLIFSARVSHTHTETYICSDQKEHPKSHERKAVAARKTTPSNDGEGKLVVGFPHVQNRFTNRCRVLVQPISSLSL